MLKIENVNENNFGNIPNPCRQCLYWQTSETFDEKMLKPEMAQKKREWFNKVTKEFRSCIKIAYFTKEKRFWKFYFLLFRKPSFSSIALELPD